ncbi:hypothetical protein ACHAQH_005182 [Verticillium albo-atrum]
MSSVTQPQTVLIAGATGHIGISAIQGAPRSGKQVLAIVRSETSAEKIWKHIGNTDQVTTVIADGTSDNGVQTVVDQVRAGDLPAFQHVYSAVGGKNTDISMLDTSTEMLRQAMAINLEPNFYAYRATIPYLLELADEKCTWTICTGAQGEWGERALPGMSQGALFPMSNAASRALAGTNVRFNEIFLACRVEVDDEA